MGKNTNISIKIPRIFTAESWLFILTGFLRISFYPKYNHVEWDCIWVCKLILYLYEGRKIVNRYIPLKHLPRIIFLSQDHIDEFVEENSFPAWVKGFCAGGDIFLLINKNYQNWRQIIVHELFHSAVCKMYSTRSVIPDWFNESMACFVGRNLNYNKITLFNCLKIDYLKIKELMINDELISECSNSYDIIKSFGIFFGSIFPAHRFRKFFFEVKKRNNFQAAFEECFQMSVNDAIDKWYHNIIVKDSTRIS